LESSELEEEDDGQGLTFFKILGTYLVFALLELEELDELSEDELDELELELEEELLLLFSEDEDYFFLAFFCFLFLGFYFSTGVSLESSLLTD
jgi:hypothetical protein